MEEAPPRHPLLFPDAAVVRAYEWGDHKATAEATTIDVPGPRRKDMNSAFVIHVLVGLLVAVVTSGADILARFYCRRRRAARGPVPLSP